MKSAQRLLSLFLLATLVTSAATGCATKKGGKWKFATWDVRRAMGLKSNKPPKPEIPQQLIATWVDTTLTTPGRKPERGFGGRIVFFGDQGTSAESVRVEGELVVYAFDETDRPSHETHPTRRFIFPEEQFAKLESPSSFGPSYSVWLPWDEVGGEERHISLIVRFEPQGGPMIAGEQTKHLLPGIARPERAMADAAPAAAPPPTGVTQASYQKSPAAGSAAASAKLTEQDSRTTTIELTPGLTQRLAGGRSSRGQAAKDRTAMESAPSPQPTQSAAPSTAQANATSAPETPAAESPDPLRTAPTWGWPSEWSADKSTGRR